MRKHPNALIGGTAAVGGGEALVEILDHFNVHVSGSLGVFLAGLIAAAVLFIGRNGIRGVARVLWRGAGKEAS